VSLVNKFGSKSIEAKRSQEAPVSSPSVAIVTINFAMEGDSTALPKIGSRDDVHAALSMIASDALVGECLLTAEVLWSPEDPSETLTRESTIVDFPHLVPI
jgi:uncharacterized membrane protein